MNRLYSIIILPRVFSKTNLPLQQATVSLLPKSASRLMLSAPSIHCLGVTDFPSVWLSNRFWIVASRALFTALVALLLCSPASHGISPVTIEFQYDDLNRLTGVARDDATSSMRYQYDAASNISWIATDESPDTDVDDLPNFVDPDDDNDGIPDAVESAAGLDALDAAGDMGASGDLDNDGITNIDEYLQGSDINHFHGDLDSDDDLDLGDIVVLKRIIFESTVATQEQTESGHGDVNMDGKLDVGDLVIMRRLYFGY